MGKHKMLKDDLIVRKYALSKLRYAIKISQMKSEQSLVITVNMLTTFFNQNKNQMSCWAVDCEIKHLSTSTYLNAKNVTNAAARQKMLKMQPKYVISDKLNSCSFET